MLKSHLVVLTLISLCMWSVDAQAQDLDLSGATVVMSSGENAALGNGPLMLDGDRMTRIATGTHEPDDGTGNDNEWVYFHLGQPYQLDQVRIDWEAAFGQDIDLLVTSTDPGADSDPTNAIWKKVAEMRGYDQDGDAAPNHGADIDNVFDFSSQTVELPSDLGGAGTGNILEQNPEAEWVMMHGIQRGSDWGFSIYEMEVSAVPEPTSISILFVGFVALLGFTARQRRRGQK